jgi:hypothetical protein
LPRHVCRYLKPRLQPTDRSQRRKTIFKSFLPLMSSVIALSAIILISLPGRLIVSVILLVAIYRLLRNGTLRLNLAWRRRAPGCRPAYKARFPWLAVVGSSVLFCVNADVDWRPRLVGGLILSILWLVRLARHRRGRRIEYPVDQNLLEPDRLANIVPGGRVIDLHLTGHGARRRWE